MKQEKRLLDRQAGRWAMLGGCLLGGGGGGSFAMGQMLLEKLESMPPLYLTPLEEIDPEATVLSVSLVGAPAAKEQFLTPEDMIRTVELFQRNAGSAPLAAVMTNENGWCATVNGWVQAAALGLPLVDAQCNGRAHPTGVMGSMNLHRLPGYVTTMTCAGGNPATGRYVEGMFRGTIDATARLVRAASVEAGGVVGVARNPVTAAYVRENGAVGGISQAIQLGQVYEQGLEVSPQKAVEAAAEFLHGRVLCRGAVEHYTLRGEGGFDVGTVTVDGHELTFWNEYMTLDAPDGSRVATFPDLIMTVDAATGRPLPSSDIREGQEVFVLTTHNRNLNLSPTMHDRELLAQAEEIIRRPMLEPLGL